MGVHHTPPTTYQHPRLNFTKQSWPAMDFGGCLDDGTIEPTVQGCRGNFDFTIKFEKIVFSVIPSALVTNHSALLLLIRRLPVLPLMNVNISDCSLRYALHASLSSGLGRLLWAALCSVPQNWCVFSSCPSFIRRRPILKSLSVLCCAWLTERAIRPASAYFLSSSCPFWP